MPFLPAGGLGGSGGGGLHFRDPVDVFADAAARSTAFSTGGTLAGQHVQFVADRSLAIVIGTLANPTGFQTYTGGSGTYDDTAWLNRADAVQGRPGPPGSDAAVNAGNVNPIIAAYDGAIVNLDIAEAQIPATIMRDAEFTAAAVRALLGLSATEVNDLLTGASLSGRALTFTQNDGSDVTITLPADSDTQDGVVASGAFNAAGTVLTLTLDTGGTVDINVPAILRAGDGVVDSLSLDLGTSTWTLTAGRSVGADIPVDLTAIKTYIDGLVNPADDHTRRAAISSDNTLEQAEYDAGSTSTTRDITIPTWSSGTRFVFLGVPEDEDDITDILQSGISEFSDWERVTGTLYNHKWWRRTDAVSIFYSGRQFTIVQ